MRVGGKADPRATLAPHALAARDDAPLSAEVLRDQDAPIAGDLGPDRLTSPVAIQEVLPVGWAVHPPIDHGSDEAVYAVALGRSALATGVDAPRDQDVSLKEVLSPGQEPATSSRDLTRKVRATIAIAHVVAIRRVVAKVVTAGHVAAVTPRDRANVGIPDQRVEAVRSPDLVDAGVDQDLELVSFDARGS